MYDQQLLKLDERGVQRMHILKLDCTSKKLTMQLVSEWPTTYVHANICNSSIRAIKLECTPRNNIVLACKLM